MPLLALLLILVLPFQRVIAFVTVANAPLWLASQPQVMMEQVSSHRGRQLTAWAKDAVSAPSSIESISKGITSPPFGYSIDHAAVKDAAELPANLLKGHHHAMLEGIPSTQMLADVQPESIPSAIAPESDLVQTLAILQEFVEKMPDSAEFGLIVVLALLAASLAKNMKGTKVADSSADSAMSTAKERKIEEAVAGLSQTVVVLTQEIKAIKDTTEGPPTLKQLEQQNAALEQELETTLGQARTLSTLQEELYQGIGEVNEITAPEASPEAIPKASTSPETNPKASASPEAIPKASTSSETNAKASTNPKTNGAVVEEASSSMQKTSSTRNAKETESATANAEELSDKSLNSADAEGETEEEYSDLLLAAMAIGFVNFVFSSIF